MPTPAQRTCWVLVLLATGGCGVDNSPVPGNLAERETPQLLYVVKNEVMGLRLDGTGRQSFGIVGDDRHRAGYPRLLPDGRFSVLGDEMGRVFLFTTAGDRVFEKVSELPSWIGDGACGVMVDDRAALVYVSTALYLDGTITSTVMRATTDGGGETRLGTVSQAALLHPSPDGADHILVVRSHLSGDDSIWRLDVTGRDPLAIAHAEVLARLQYPETIRSPARLPDGRVVFVRLKMDDPYPRGELWLVKLDGSLKDTGIHGVVDAIVVGKHVVFEAGGADGVSDLISTDLKSPPVNLTRTPYVSEHLGWSQTQ